jgi:hypothetical protein
VLQCGKHKKALFSLQCFFAFDFFYALFSHKGNVSTTSILQITGTTKKAHQLWDTVYFMPVVPVMHRLSMWCLWVLAQPLCTARCYSKRLRQVSARPNESVKELLCQIGHLDLAEWLKTSKLPNVHSSNNIRKQKKDVRA